VFYLYVTSTAIKEQQSSSSGYQYLVLYLIYLINFFLFPVQTAK